MEGGICLQPLAEDIFYFRSISVFSALEVSYENALDLYKFKFTFDFDFDPPNNFGVAPPMGSMTERQSLFSVAAPCAWNRLNRQNSNCFAALQL